MKANGCPGGSSPGGRAQRGGVSVSKNSPEAADDLPIRARRGKQPRNPDSCWPPFVRSPVRSLFGQSWQSADRSIDRPVGADNGQDVLDTDPLGRPCPCPGRETSTTCPPSSASHPWPSGPGRVTDTGSALDVKVCMVTPGDSPMSVTHPLARHG